VQLETNGDPWTNYSNVDPANVTYFWDYFYFVLILLTTIGFGDISPHTTLGKLFLVFYVLLCLVRCCCCVVRVCNVQILKRICSYLLTLYRKKTDPKPVCTNFIKYAQILRILSLL